MVEDPEPLLTLTTVATLLRVHVETVRRLIRRGELRAVRIGGQWRVRREDLDRYLEAWANRPVDGQERRR